MEMKRFHVFVSGRVQGVAFREHTRRTAASLHINGWVKNLSDGRVEAVLEGPQDVIDAMIRWCRQGPPLADVKEIEIIEESFNGQMDNFSIRY